MHVGNGQRVLSEVTGKGPGPGVRVVKTMARHQLLTLRYSLPTPRARPSQEKMPLEGLPQHPIPLGLPLFLPLTSPVKSLPGVCTPTEPPVPVQQRLYFLP